MVLTKLPMMLKKQLRMARDTWDKLKMFAGLKGCGCKGNSDAPDWDLVRRFLQEWGGPDTREINDSELENKRLILRVPPR